MALNTGNLYHWFKIQINILYQLFSRHQVNLLSNIVFEIKYILLTKNVTIISIIRFTEDMHQGKNRFHSCKQRKRNKEICQGQQKLFKTPTRWRK